MRDWIQEHYRQRVILRKWVYRLFIVACWLGIIVGPIWLAAKLMGY